MQKNYFCLRGITVVSTGSSIVVSDSVSSPVQYIGATEGMLKSEQERNDIVCFSGTYWMNCYFYEIVVSREYALHSEQHQSRFQNKIAEQLTDVRSIGPTDTMTLPSRGDTSWLIPDAVHATLKTNDDVTSLQTVP